LADDEHVLTASAMRRLLYRRDVALARHRATLARKLGVTDIEMLALVHLAEQGELAPSALAKLLDLSSGGTTALVQRLERYGHATRKPHPTDRRSTLIYLSPETAERLEETASPHFRALASVAAAFTEPERVAVAHVLTRLAAVSEELETVARHTVEPTSDALTRPVPSLWA
jgi:DNA-binding MarR family transcriptional regulator